MIGMQFVSYTFDLIIGRLKKEWFLESQSSTRIQGCTSGRPAQVMFQKINSVVQLSYNFLYKKRLRFSWRKFGEAYNDEEALRPDRIEETHIGIATTQK